MRTDLRQLDTPERRRGASTTFVSPGGADSQALLRWLDDGLRGARPGRIAEEYRAILSDPSARHVVIEARGRPVSHALFRSCTVRAGARALRIGMIGLVYTDPGHRREGLAGRCVGAALRRLAREGACATALWSSEPRYYERLGFLPAGLERLVGVDAKICRAAMQGGRAHLSVGPPVSRDWPELEKLHAAKPVRVDRKPGNMAALAGAPECRLVVARQGQRPVAYAAIGKGDDFRGVVHDWAGDPEAVLACLVALTEPTGEALLLAGPGSEAPIRALLEAGAPVLERPFGLVHLADAEGLWRALAGAHPALAQMMLRADPCGYRLETPGGDVRLDLPELLQLLFGPAPPRASLACLAAEQRQELLEALPWPLFVWGFDSI